MAHQSREKYSALVLEKIRASLVLEDGVVFNNDYEGDPVSGSVKIPVRDDEVAVSDYDKANGISVTHGSTTYTPLLIDKDKAVNELIDGFDAASVPDNLIADRLDSAGYALARQMDTDGATVLLAGATVKNVTQLASQNIYSVIVDIRTDMSKANIPDDGKRYLLCVPEVIALPFGEAVEECGMRFMGVPANHSTSRVTDGVLERTSLYLVEKGPARLLYATDTGGITGDAARMIGIDSHVRPQNIGKYKSRRKYVHDPMPITAFIMEATDGDQDDDFRLFVHSSVQTVSRTVNMLLRTGRYVPPAGQHAYITHLGIKYRSWPSEKIDVELPEPLRAAYDGLELVLG